MGRIIDRLIRRRSLRWISAVMACSFALLMVLSVGALRWALGAAEARAAAVVQGREIIAMAYSLARTASLVQTDHGTYLITSDPRALAAYHADVASFRKEHADLTALVAGDPTHVERIRTVGALFEEIASDGAELSVGPGALTATQRLAVLAKMERMEKLQATLQAVVGAQKSVVAGGTRASQELSRSIDLGAVLATWVVVALSAAGVFSFSRLVAVRLAELTRSAQAISRGDLRRRVAVHRDDEIGNLAASFNRMAEQLDAERRQDGVLRELRELMHGVYDVDEAARILTLLAPECLPQTSGWVYLLEDDGELLMPRGGWADRADPRPFAAPSCWAFRLGRVHEASPTRHSVPCAHVHQRDRGSICIPLGARGEVIGILEVSFDGEVPRGVTEVAESLALALANIRLRERMRDEAQRDALTGLFNRRYLDRMLARELARAAHSGGPLAVALIDVDHFKRFNDTHGHAAGDAALREVAATLRRTCRGSDTVCRYGGEEFVVVLPDCGLEEAVRKAEAVRSAVASVVVHAEDRALEHVTISVGVAAFPAGGRQPATLLAAADRALYRSKALGRDRVTADGPVTLLPAAG